MTTAGCDTFSALVVLLRIKAKLAGFNEMHLAWELKRKDLSIVLARSEEEENYTDKK